MVSTFVERHHEMIQGEISCFDRVVITGSLPDIGHGQAMEAYLRYHKVLLKDYPRWAEPMRVEIRAHAERLAEEAGLSIEFIRTYKSFRKERRIKDILAERGGAPGLVHVFSAMEGCTSFRSWTDKTTGHTRLKPVPGQVPALLLLLHRRSIRADVPAGSHLGSVPPPGLSQRSPLAGAASGRSGDRPYSGRQCVHRHR